MNMDIQSAVTDTGRLAAVRATGLLYTEPEERFDRLTRRAARTLKVPAAFVSLVTEEADFYKSSYGFNEPLASGRVLTGPTFCHYALLSGEVLVLDDARLYDGFREVPTIHSLGVIAYVGIPLISSDGFALGAFCVIDFKPRDWSKREIGILKRLASAAGREIEGRLQERDFGSGSESAVRTDSSEARNNALPIPGRASVASDVAGVFSPLVEVAREKKTADFSFEDLYDQHSPMVYAVLMRMLRNAHDAQEVLQETFLQAWRQRDRFDESRGSATAWLIMIARSRSIDRLRQRQLREPFEQMFDANTYGKPDARFEGIENRLTFTAQGSRLRTVLAQLPPAQRTAIEMAYFDGLSQSEIALQLGEPLGTVKTRILLGMKKLRQALVPPASSR